MGLFSSKDNTISDKDYKALQDRAHKANQDSFSKKAIEQRLASEKQRLQRKSS